MTTFPPNPPRHVDRPLYALVTLFLLLAVLALNDVLIYNPDSARYLIWARSLAESEGFQDQSIPEPLHYVVHAPLYSLLLAPAAFIAPNSVIAGKILTVLLGCGLLVLFLFWVRRLDSPPAPVLATAILAVHPLTLIFSHQILSEIPFGIAIIATLVLVDRIVKGESSATRDELLLAAVLSAAALLREVGVTLVLATAIFFAAHRRFRKALVMLAVPLFVYGLWFVRNEIIVAGTEHPALRNSEILTLHYFTPRDATLIEEFLARLRINGAVYADHLARLCYLPQYGPSVYGIVSTTTAPYSFVAGLEPVLFIVLAIVSLGTSLVGLISSVKKHASVEFLIAFVPVYLLIILIYPFNDVRFLFPLVLLIVAFSVIGTLDILRRIPPLASRLVPVAWGLFGLLMLPNLLWAFAYVRDAMQYRTSPADFFESVADQRPFPDMLTKPSALAGKWIAEQSPEPVTVLTQWKDLALSLPNGKLVDVNTLVPLDEFDRLVRDYEVEYIMSAVGLADIPEFFPQMQVSALYSFESVFRVANLEVFRATEKTGPAFPGGEGRRGRFALGLRALSEGRIDSAGAVFESLAQETGGGTTIVLFLAIAHEFRGNLAEARRLLVPLQTLKQAGAFLGHATYHLEIIDLLERAAEEKNPAVRAELLYVASVKYWNLGFRTQSLAVLDSSLAVDPLFPPALIFSTYYRLELGQRKEARRYFDRLVQSIPDHPLVIPFRAILAYKDSIAASPKPRPAHFLSLAEAYEQAGLGDSAIRELLVLRKRLPQNLDARKTLSRLYISKRRYAPALRMVEEWLLIDPLDKEAIALRDELKARW